MELLRETERFALQRTEVSVQRVESSDGKAEKQKYGVIEDSNKKAERSYSPGNVLCVYSFVYSDTEKVVKKE